MAQPATQVIIQIIRMLLLRVTGQETSLKVSRTSTWTWTRSIGKATCATCKLCDTLVVIIYVLYIQVVAQLECCSAMYSPQSYILLFVSGIAQQYREVCFVSFATFVALHQPYLSITGQASFYAPQECFSLSSLEPFCAKELKCAPVTQVREIISW